MLILHKSLLQVVMVAIVISMKFIIVLEIFSILLFLISLFIVIYLIYKIIKKSKYFEYAFLISIFLSLLIVPAIKKVVLLIFICYITIFNSEYLSRDKWRTNYNLSYKYCKYLVLVKALKNSKMSDVTSKLGHPDSISNDNRNWSYYLGTRDYDIEPDVFSLNFKDSLVIDYFILNGR